MGPGATQSVRGIYKSFTETNLTVVEGLHQRIMYILQVGQQVKRGRSVRRGGGYYAVHRPACCVRASCQLPHAARSVLFGKSEESTDTTHSNRNCAKATIQYARFDVTRRPNGVETTCYHARLDVTAEPSPSQTLRSR